MSQLKRALSILLTLCLLAGTLAGCSGKTADTGGIGGKDKEVDALQSDPPNPTGRVARQGFEKYNA